MIKDIKANIKPLLRLALILSFPLFIVIIYGWFLIPIKIEFLKETFAFASLTLIFIGLVSLLNNKKNRLWFSYALSIILYFLVFVKLSFYINYNVKISASALFVIFETNGIEASDFLINYFNYKVILLTVFLIFFIFVSFFFLRKINVDSIKTSIQLKIISTVIIFILAFFINNNFSNENLVLTSLYSYKRYNKAKSNLRKSLAKNNTSNFKNVKSLDAKQTYIIIIGESTSSWHMQLYGYNRETNPLLTEIKNELLIFNNVITPNVHTVLALDKILTRSNYQEPYKKNNASVVQLANKAGFETYWISNQWPVSWHESLSKLIGSAAKYQDYIAPESKAVYDESLFPYLDKALDDVSSKKMIFLHLAGTHSSYKNHYPKTYNFFKSETNTPFKNSSSKNIINEYDNAIRYNDFIVREIIEKVRNKNVSSYVLYFSDHGDEVYDTFDFVGHNEYHGTRPMYEIPFITWFSDEYKKNNKELFSIKNIIDRPYVLEDFIHSFAELSKITFDEFDFEKSIFNDKFKKKQRIIKKGEDYDKK